MGTEITAYRGSTGAASLVSKTNPMPTGANCSYANVATNTTTTAKSGAGIFYGIVVNATAAGTITIYDNTSATGTKIGTLKSNIAEGTYNFHGVNFSTGLTVVTAAASDITILYN